MKSLAIEKEYGTDGWELGKQIAEKEGIPFYDEKAIITNAEKMGHKLELLKNYEQKKKESILYNIAMIAERETELKIEIEQMVRELFVELKETVEQLHAKESAVFVGKGICGLIGMQSKFVKVFLDDSQKEDKQKSTYFHMLPRKEWDKPDNYDLVFDISKVSRDTICRDICHEMEK